jgi:hypothetical protein
MASSAPNRRLRASNRTRFFSCLIKTVTAKFYENTSQRIASDARMSEEAVDLRLLGKFCQSTQRTGPCRKVATLPSRLKYRLGVGASNTGVF